MAVATVSAGWNIQASDIRLGRLLQEHGLINDYQLFDALQTQAANGGRLGPILVRRGCLSDQQLTNVMTTRREHLDVASHVSASLAPVPADHVSLPGAVSMCLTLKIAEKHDPDTISSDGCFATMPIMLPAEATDWLVVASGRHAADRFELISEDQVGLTYDLAVRPHGSRDLFPLVAGGASAVHLDGETSSSNPVHAIVEACIPGDVLREAPAGHYVEYIDLAITHHDSDFLG
jgi:hypothetical protein